jgi:hypothetical protein
MLHAARRGLLVALTLGAALAPALGAQDLADLCRSLSAVTVGQWASYAGIGGRLDASQSRLAAVGSERTRDSTLYWLELNHASAQNPGDVGIVQVLVPSFGLDLSGIRGLIVKTGAQPPMRIPNEVLPLIVQQLGQTNSVFEMAYRCTGAETVGWETVMVPAGAIRSLHVKTAGGEAWLSPDVPFGFVKLAFAAGGQMVLTGRGTDAKSSIPETP